MTSAAQYLDNSSKKQILELVPISDSGPEQHFQILYSGTPEQDANETVGLVFKLFPLESNLPISLSDNYETSYHQYYAFGRPHVGDNGSGVISLAGNPISLWGNFPGASSLPVSILEFSIPYQGPISLEITEVASGFNGVIEYSDDPRFPSLLPVTASGATAVNSVGAANDKFDYFSIVVPEGSTIGQVSLGSFAGTGSASYSIYESSSNDLFGNLVAEGTISSEASPESFATIGDNLLSTATTGSAELTEGLYTIKVENQTNSEIAYQLDFQKTLVSLPRLNAIEDSPIDLPLPATATDGTPFSWLASGLPEWLSLEVSNGQSRLIGQAPLGFNGLSPSFSLTATTDESSARTQRLSVAIYLTPFASIPELKAYEDTPFSFELPITSARETTLNWSASVLPDWATLITVNGRQRIEGNPPLNYNGSFNVDLSLIDSSGFVKGYPQQKLEIAAVNDAPTLSTVDSLTGLEDTFEEISFSDLASAANEADIDGDSLAFRIESLSTGTLQKWNASSLLWESTQPGSTLISASEKLRWKGSQDSNGELNAFTIKAWDGALASTSAVQVKLDVAAVNDAPTLSVVNALTGAVEDTFKEISFSDLAAAANEADVEGDSLTFRIESLSTGTLQKWNASSLLWESVQLGSTRLSATEKLQWKGPQDSNGELNAFTIKAWDGALASSSAVQVKLDVAAVNDAPTLSVVNALTGAVEDTFKEISFSDLAAAANEADVDGDSLSFRIESLSIGTLQKWNASSLLWESVQLGSTLFSASEKLQWKGPQDSNGELNAFTIKAWDGALASSAAVQVKLDVAAVNDAPTLSTVNSLTGALEDTFEEISFSDLASAANEADVDGDSLSFRIESLSTGTLQKWNASSLLWESVQPGLTLISASEKLQWKGSQDSNGELNAFTIKAWDGALASSFAVQVKLDVAAVNDKPIVNWVLEPLIVNKGSSLFFTIPDQFFTDPDSSLSFSASTSTGDALPSWLSFNAATRTLSGTPTSSGTFNFSINAADELESVSAPLTLKVREVQQLSSSTEPIRYLRNKDLTVPINYSISDASSSTGLAFKVHFDSSLFSFDHNTGVSNEAQADLFQVGAVQFDIADSDNDPTTDRFIPISIASFSGQFAGGSAPIKLADLSFSTADKPIDPLTGLRDTSINFSETTVATGYGFASTSASLQPLLFNLDVDGDEAVTALGDGLMIIRKLFGPAFAGDALTNKAISPDATRTTPEIHDFIQSGIDGDFLDVDKDGATTALGDGLMVIRRLFGPAFTGEALISKAISPESPYYGQENAWELVAANIDALIP